MSFNTRFRMEHGMMDGEVNHEMNGEIEHGELIENSEI